MAALEKSTGKSKVLRFLLKGFLLLIILSIMAVAAPRIWSVLNPDKPPVGYHFMVLAYVALWTGLEKLLNTTPQDVTATLSYRLLNDGPYPACAEAVVDIYGPADLTTEYAINHALVTSFIARSCQDSPGLVLLREFDNLHRTTLCSFLYFILIIRKVYSFNYNCNVLKFKNFRTNFFA
jgi:hypothetical protein